MENGRFTQVGCGACRGSATANLILKWLKVTKESNIHDGSSFISRITANLSTIWCSIKHHFHKILKSQSNSTGLVHRFWSFKYLHHSHFHSQSRQGFIYSLKGTHPCGGSNSIPHIENIYHLKNATRPLLSIVSKKVAPPKRNHNNRPRGKFKTRIK